MNIYDYSIPFHAEHFVDRHFIHSVSLPKLPRFPSARQRKYHRLRHKATALVEITPLSRFNRRFFRVAKWSWREYAFMHMFQHGVIKDEFQSELEWARSRKLSMHRTFANLAGPDHQADLDYIIAKYGIEDVSAAKVRSRVRV